MNKLITITAQLTAFLLLFWTGIFAQAPNIIYTPAQYTFTNGITIPAMLPINLGGVVPADGYGTVSTYAGNGISGTVNGPALQASFKDPWSLTFDNAGNLFVIDRGSRSIRKITSSGIVSTIAGNGTGIAVDGTGTAAGFKDPISLAVDNAGNLYVAETNGTIRKINSAGTVTTLAGQPDVHSFADGTGNLARFYYPTALAINQNGDILLADERNYRIRKITPAGLVSTFAGDGTFGFADGPGSNAEFKYMTNAAMDAAGNFYVTDDPANYKIRKVTPTGIVSTFAGPGASGTLSSFLTNGQLAFDRQNNLYVSEFFKNIIYKVTPAGVVSIFVGKLNVAGSSDGSGNSARFFGPQGMTVDASGNLYVADANNQLIRKIVTNGYDIDKALPSGLIFDNTTGKISGTPTAISPATTYIITAHNSSGNSSTSISIEVKANTGPVTPPSISYQSPKIYTIGDVVNLPVTSSGGAVPAGGFSIVPILPPGLSFNVDNGLISGTPTSASAATIYTVTATNAATSSTATVNIKVLAAPPTTISAPVISYQTPKVYPPNAAIAPLIPSNAGGEVKKYSPGLLKNFAGTGIADRDNGPKDQAEFNSPAQMIFDGSGNIFLADIANYAIRKITPAGVVSVYAGGNQQGYFNGPAGSAQFKSPQGIAMDKQGNIFVADHTAIRKITPAGMVTTLAGGSNPGFDDGAGSNARFSGAVSLAIDQDDNLYVADQNNLLIRKVTPAGVVSTLAGNKLQGHLNGQGAAATFDGPSGITIDAAGNLYVADYLTIRKITPAGLVTTIAGNGTQKVINGPAASASFGNAKAITLTPSGDIYIADIGNDVPNESSDVLRLLDVNGNVSTIDLRTNGSTRAFLAQPASITYHNEELYVTGNNNYIQTISFDKYTIDKPLPAGLSFDKFTGIISGTPTVLQPPTNYVVTAYNSGGINSTTVSIEIRDLSGLQSSIITFPPPTGGDTWDTNYNLDPHITSNNHETPIVITSSNPAVLTVNPDGTLHVVGMGTVTITASQAGNVNYNAATPVSQVIILTKDPQILAFQQLSDRTVCDTDFPSSVTSSNITLPIIYTSSNTSVATISANGMVHIVGAGTTNITASQNSSALYTAAIPVTRMLTVTPMLTPSVAISSSSPGIYCTGNNLLFTATATDAPSPNYQWKVNGIDAGTNNAMFQSAALVNGDKVSCVIMNNPPGAACFTTLTATSNEITVNATAPPALLPTVLISATSLKIYRGTVITFTASTSNAGSSISYQWQVNGVNAGTNSDTFTTADLNDGDQVTCTVTSDIACTAPVTSNALFITVMPPATIVPPNTFTPNNDGINDTWAIPTLAYFPKCRVSVYNRNGSLLMQSTGYNKAWDGTYNGKQLPAGVYYYIIDTGDGRAKVSGSVTIIR